MIHTSGNDYGHTTQTVPAMLTDEWADEFPADPAPYMSRAELNEAANRLGHLHQLVGEQAAEVVALLVMVLHRRDGASMMVLRWLRDLDGLARGDS